MYLLRKTLIDATQRENARNKSCVTRNKINEGYLVLHSNLNKKIPCIRYFSYTISLSAQLYLRNVPTLPT